ncbi:hypothetical protein HK104_004507 [Borealophlyctis nickersoniae]|nr:hypothetical protein HK104_004507 [Borealophlyctis nickersoniae]
MQPITPTGWYSTRADWCIVRRDPVARYSGRRHYSFGDKETVRELYDLFNEDAEAREAFVNKMLDTEVRERVKELREAVEEERVEEERKRVEEEERKRVNKGKKGRRRGSGVTSFFRLW